jgi:hypothetical protein
MFGVGEQIGGHMPRVGAGVDKQENFARPGNGVNIHFAEYQSLGRRDENISRSDDLVDFGTEKPCHEPARQSPAPRRHEFGRRRQLSRGKKDCRVFADWAKS